MNACRHENKIILNYIYDLFSEGLSIEEIAERMGTKVWCIRHLFVLESQGEPS